MAKAIQGHRQQERPDPSDGVLALQANFHSGETRSGPDNLHCRAE